MPVIPTYERRVSIGGPMQAPRVSPDAVAAPYRALDKIGQAVSSIADAVAHHGKLEQQKVEDQNALTANTSLSQGDEYWNQRTNELRQGWKVGDEDLRGKFNSEFDQWAAAQRQNLKTDKARQWFDSHAGAMRSRLSSGLYDWQDKTTTDKLAADMGESMERDFRLLENDPTRFDEVTSRTGEAIDSQSRIPEGNRARIKQQYIANARKAVETGQMIRDPAAWLASRFEQGAEGAAPAAAAPGGDALFDGLIHQESGGSQFNKDGSVKTSSAGAIGIAQVMPGTAPEAARLAGLPFDEQRYRNDPEYNKALGRAYFNEQMRTFGGDPKKALAAYNMGPGSDSKGGGVKGLVAKYGEDWLSHAPAETQNYVASIMGRVGAGSPTSYATAGLQEKGDAPEAFKALPIEQRQAMFDEATRRVRQNDAQLRGAADRLMTDAAAMHADGKVDPFNLTPAYFVRAYGADGPRRAAEYQAGRAMAEDISQFATMPPAQIATTLEASKPQGGEGYAAADARQRIRVQAAEAVMKQRAEDPAAFAMRQGLTTSQPIDMSKPETMVAELNKRTGAALMMRDTYGAPLKPLTTGEAAQMSAALRLFPTQQKLQYLDAVRSGFADPAVYRAALQQIAPDSPVTAVAGLLVGKGRDIKTSHWFSADETLTPRTVAGVILEGEAILNPTRKDKSEDGRGGKFPMPKELDLQQSFTAYVGEAFRADPEGYATAYQAFKAYYAGSASRKGVLSDVIDSTRAREAAMAVTGGVIDYNGAGDVLKPWGMDDGTFKDTTARAFDLAMVQNGYKGTAYDNLSAYGLQSVGDGRYLVTNGDKYLTARDGRPVELNLNMAPPDTARRKSGVVSQ